MKLDLNALPFDQASEWVVGNIALGNCLRRNTPKSEWECVPLNLGAFTTWIILFIPFLETFQDFNKAY